MPAYAQPADDPVHDASQHFRRGVDLYNEANYAAALVEFRRAYALSPNAAALFNVGEAQYQLQDYAGALKSFRRFLADSAPNEAHRAEVEANVQVLRARVGRVRITTTPSGADVTVDDQSMGKTPLDDSVLVSVGRHKIVASMERRSPAAQYLDVAAGDDLPVMLTLPAAGEAVVPPTRDPTTAPGSSESHGVSLATLATVGWISAATLAAGSATLGALAISEARDLKSARSDFPGSSTTLNRDSNLTRTYSLVADSLGIAAIVVAGLSLYWTLSAPSADTSRHGHLSRVHPMLGLASGRLEITF